MILIPGIRDPSRMDPVANALDIHVEPSKAVLDAPISTPRAASCGSRMTLPRRRSQALADFVRRLRWEASVQRGGATAGVRSPSRGSHLSGPVELRDRKAPRSGIARSFRGGSPVRPLPDRVLRRPLLTRGPACAFAA